MRYTDTAAARIAAAAAGQSTWDTERRDHDPEDRAELRRQWERVWHDDPHNAQVLTECRRLAAERAASPIRFIGNWIDMPQSGHPDPVLAPMLAAARVAAIPVGVHSPDGPNAEFRRIAETGLR